MLNETARDNQGKHILFCRCGGEMINRGLLRIVEAHLENLPVAVTFVSDLCGAAVLKKEELAKLAVHGDNYLVIGCHRRTLALLLNEANSNTSGHEEFGYINMIGQAPGEVIRQIDTFAGGNTGTPVNDELKSDSEWPSWYPVIDYARCTACGQCADFCLFGVYEKNNGNVIVVNPLACKNNCPACARICPSAAIIFPKYKNGGAIGGSDEIDELAEQKRQSVNLRETLGDDIYAAMMQRREKRESIIREEAMKRAVEERDKALDKNRNK